MIRRAAAVAVVILAALVIFSAAAVVELASAGDVAPRAYFPAILRQSDPTPTPTATPQPTPTATRPADCHPSYPTVCIPPPPPDLDCPELVPLVNFQVLPPDPHRLDADKDGIGCENP
mgnify:CR=1 FL=1